MNKPDRRFSRQVGETVYARSPSPEEFYTAFQLQERMGYSSSGSGCDENNSSVGHGNLLKRKALETVNACVLGSTSTAVVPTTSVNAPSASAQTSFSSLCHQLVLSSPVTNFSEQKDRNGVGDYIKSNDEIMSAGGDQSQVLQNIQNVLETFGELSVKTDSATTAAKSDGGESIVEREKSPKLRGDFSDGRITDVPTDPTSQFVADIERLKKHIEASSGDTKNNVDSTGSDTETKRMPEEEEMMLEHEKKPRRCSSLKVRRDPSNSPAQKKIVRFADAMGLDLADVRTFPDEVPSVPKSAYQDLDNTEDCSSPPSSFARLSDLQIQNAPSKCVVPMFKQPGEQADFFDRIRESNVCLEKVTASECNNIHCIGGTVRVRNLDFYKSVYVRFSVDNWCSFAEVQGSYVSDSCDGFTDQFQFTIYLYSTYIGQRIELAVRFHCSGSQFWDNNRGSNYCFQCIPKVPIIEPSPYHNVNVPDTICDSFY